MKTITFYQSDGQIIFTMTGTESDIELNKTMNPLWVDGDWNDDLYYVKDGVATLRPKNTAQWEGGKLSNLPTPCVIWINSTRYECHDDKAELELVYDGKYTIRVQAFPYLDAEFEIEN